MNNRDKLSTEQIFQQIAIDIRKNPNRYLSAGKFLDEYCSVEKFWERRGKELEEMESDELFGFDVDGKAMIEYLRCMIKLREGYYSPHELIKLRAEYEGVNLLTTEEVEEMVKGESVQKGSLFYDAYLAYWKRSDWPVGFEGARCICLITWLLTDPDAEKSGFNITEFENWSWKKRMYLYKPCIRNMKWTNLVHMAWDKLEAEKELGTKGETGKRGRKKKFTDEQVKQMQNMYEQTYYETNDSKGSWSKVADFYGFPSCKAAETYCRRNLKR